MRVPPPPHPPSGPPIQPYPVAKPFPAAAPLPAPAPFVPRKKTYEIDSDSYSDSGSDSDSDVGYVRRRIRKLKARNQERGSADWRGDNYIRPGFVKIKAKKDIIYNTDSESESDSDTDIEDVVKIELKLKREEDIVKKLLEMWTPQERSIKEKEKV